MMKISSFFSRSSKRPTALFAGVAISLKFFGPVPELVKEDNPWTGLRDDAPVLTVIRAEQVPLGGPLPSTCEAWVNALKADQVGQPVTLSSEKEWAQAAQRHWAPWKADDLEGINQCAKLPCKIKLSGAEVAAMAEVPAAARRDKFFSLTFARAQRYLKTEARKEYEFEGDPVDPWKWFIDLGLKSGLATPPKPELALRRIDFFPGRVQTLHQILDTRKAVAPDRKSATLWRRDVYTDHYFDSWGEWADVSCDAASVTVVQALLVELDLMKKTDVMSKLMRSKMRGAVEDNGMIYLTQAFERLKRRATKGGSPAAAASGSSK